MSEVVHSARNGARVGAQSEAGLISVILSKTRRPIRMRNWIFGVAALAVFAMLVCPVRRARDPDAECKGLARVYEAVVLYRLDKGEWPHALSDLQASTNEARALGLNGPFLAPGDASSPEGKALFYSWAPRTEILFELSYETARAWSRRPWRRFVTHAQTIAKLQRRSSLHPIRVRTKVVFEVVRRSKRRAQLIRSARTVTGRMDLRRR